MDTYTIYATYYKGTADEVTEEVDVQAESHEKAYEAAKAELDENYLPGYSIERVIRRTGLFL
jgi:hypothetical protein